MNRAAARSAAPWHRRLRFFVDQFRPLPEPREAEHASLACYAQREHLADFERHASFGLYEAEREILRASILRPAQSVLDIGCGAGREAIAFDEHGLRVTAIDASPEMIERARRMAAGRNLTFEVMSLTDLRFADRSFDAAYISSDVYQRTPRRAARVQSLVRLAGIVRAGGAIVFAVRVSPTISRRVRILVETPRAFARSYWPDRVPERGDVFTRDTSGGPALYRHVFETDAEVHDEILDAGLVPESKFGDFFVARSAGGPLRYQAPATVSATSIAKGLLVADVGAGVTYRLNATGAEIWRRLDAGDSLDDAAPTLAARFGVSPERVARDGEALVAELTRMRLLRLREVAR